MSGQRAAAVHRGLARQHGEMTPAEIGHDLGLPEPAVPSIVRIAAEAGRVRVTSVERLV